MAKPETLPGETVTGGSTGTGDVTPPGFRWETMDAGLGTQWDFESQPVFQGFFLGHTTRDTDDPNNPGQTRASNVYQFTRPADDRVYFVWGSAGLDMAFLTPDGEVRMDTGDVVRITYQGKERMRNGQTFKNYRVQRAVPENQA